jgi:hypothetical protein
VLFDAALETSDGFDGVEDGLISNVPDCEALFIPETATLNGTPIRVRWVRTPVTPACRIPSCRIPGHRIADGSSLRPGQRREWPSRVHHLGDRLRHSESEPTAADGADAVAWNPATRQPDAAGRSAG